MLPDGTIQAHRIWKRFRADRSRMLLRDEIERFAARFRDESQKGWRWALRDVGFDAAPGESIGLVGANGSGKSTLLKLLCRVMYPYAGRIEVAGRVGALIEVRAGIHPDLSGRENVRLYGSLLGLRRQEVARRFDEIVAFAELESAIDRQVKFYSSGMQMRLGFAVAAFLQPDVLLVDEVLAVGDASFQQKCLERMRAVLAQGTTLIFVSHDLAAVEATCQRGLWLSNGVVQADGPVRDVLAAYRRSIEESAKFSSHIAGAIRLVKVELAAADGGAPKTGKAFDVSLTLESPRNLTGRVLIGVSEGPATPIFVARKDVSFGKGETSLRCSIQQLPLPRGRYYVWVGVFARGNDLLPWQPCGQLDAIGPELDPVPPGVVRLAPIHVETEWSVGDV